MRNSTSCHLDDPFFWNAESIIVPQISINQTMGVDWIWTSKIRHKSYFSRNTFKWFFVCLSIFGAGPIYHRILLQLRGYCQWMESQLVRGVFQLNTPNDVYAIWMPQNTQIETTAEVSSMVKNMWKVQGLVSAVRSSYFFISTNYTKNSGAMQTNIFNLSLVCTLHNGREDLFQFLKRRQVCNNFRLTFTSNWP